jgi:glycosyltransferase involved in cell wall biosynthesis
MARSVTVVTPSFNQGRFIERTIRSVLSQEISGDLEYLVMDGGSKDETVDILKRYEASLEWVSERDRGQADAVNKGLARARGDVIGWLNSDDIYYPGAIAAACQALDLHPEAGVVYGEADHIDEQGAIIEPYPTEAWDFDALLQRCYLCQPAVFFRRSVVERFGGLNPTLHFCLDYEYWLRLAAAGVQFVWVRQKLAGSRLYAETKTLGSRIRFHTEINDMMRRYTGRVPDRWLFNYAHAVLDEKGISRSEPLRFPVFVSAVSIYAALRWNHSISGEMRRMTAAWTGGALRNYCRRQVKT